MDVSHGYIYINRISGYIYGYIYIYHYTLHTLGYYPRGATRARQHGRQKRGRPGERSDAASVRPAVILTNSRAFHKWRFPKMGVPQSGYHIYIYSIIVLGNHFFGIMGIIFLGLYHPI